MITTRQDKVKSTIARVEKQLAKIKATGKADWLKAKKYNDHMAYLYQATIDQLEEQLASNQKKLIEAKRLDAREAEMKSKKAQKENVLDSIPESLKKFAKRIEDATFADRLRIHKECRAKQRPHFNDYSPEAIAIRANWHFDEAKERKDARQIAEHLVLNLIARTEKKIGKITDASYLKLDDGNRYEGTVITGFITGEKGKVVVSTIEAGGYNIQCWHTRVLVK